ncbi:serine hydrolase domain-containing protein [Georgenia thermotolerans]|uniref:Serine hydrolase n=1 Tax=Georgenia thermotolerans TaxID=527326 RepID=A0A7J5UP59_9MICO|nr:serine hydrolase domain-containing protein [Georgenia thermotolerans]KAE8764196.1 serine hydrolase [Georgenia thermotolerans]
MTRRLESRLDALLGKYAARPDTGTVRLALTRPSTGLEWTYGDPDGQYFVASITKLFTTAVVLQLVDDGQVELDATLPAYLPDDVVSGLHVLDGVDRSEQVTVRQLLSNTSGLGDVSEQRQPDGSTLFAVAFASDPGWTFEELLAVAKERIRPAFPPGTPGKAQYSDTNFQLLGRIIEVVTGLPYARAVERRITQPLALAGTYVFETATMDRFDTVDAILNGRRPLRIPRTLASTQAQGGIVSSTSDSLRFLRAFFAGELFDAHHLEHMQARWNRIFPPMRYGTGLMRFAVPRVMSPFAPVPAMVGHGGSSGAVLFHALELDLFVAGTVNQIAKRRLPYPLLARVAVEVRRG